MYDKRRADDYIEI